MAATTSNNCSNFFVFRSNSTPKMRPSSSGHHGSCRAKVDGVGMWLVNSVSAAFFASLERCSCIRIATHDDAADDGNVALPLIFHDGNLERQFGGVSGDLSFTGRRRMAGKGNKGIIATS